MPWCRQIWYDSDCSFCILNCRWRAQVSCTRRYLMHLNEYETWHPTILHTARTVQNCTYCVLLLHPMVTYIINRVFCPHGVLHSVWTLTANTEHFRPQHCIFSSDKCGLFLCGRNWIWGVLYKVEENRLRRTLRPTVCPSVCNLASGTDFFSRFYKIQCRSSASCRAVTSFVNIGLGKAALFPRA